MLEVTIVCSVERCLEIVRELRGYGCVQGRDFDFAYVPTVDNWNDLDNMFAASHADFTFKSELGERCGTLIGLKYG